MRFSTIRCWNRTPAPAARLLSIALARSGNRRDDVEMILRWLARRRAFRALVEEHATMLIARDGKPAYSTARALQRLAKAKGDREATQLPGIFSDYAAPIVRSAPDGVRELALVRWGMPSSKKRSATLRPPGRQVARQRKGGRLQ
jgi:hypothetical protein